MHLHVKFLERLKIMTTIYEQHEKSFAKVSAHVILRDGERVATVAFKYPKDGMGRLWCYLHVLGLPMVRGYAGGYGYDKASAAFLDAAKAPTVVKLEDWQQGEHYIASGAHAVSIYEACAARAGHDWQRNVTDAGYIVLKAV